MWLSSDRLEKYFSRRLLGDDTSVRYQGMEISRGFQATDLTHRLFLVSKSLIVVDERGISFIYYVVHYFNNE